jgi:hypothetical protein
MLQYRQTAYVKRKHFSILREAQNVQIRQNHDTDFFSVTLPSHIHIYNRTRRSRGTAPAQCSGGARFKSRPGHWLS